jgi:Protein of unknown function (DUF3089)
VDYANTAMWLCRPDVTTGACRTPRNVLSVAPDGSVKPMFYQEAVDPQIDCFYLYPTVSEDRTGNSDLVPGLEVEATYQQFSQLGARCRQFAPLYRSITLRELGAELRGLQVPGTDYELPYRDVLNAWHYYIEHDNKGRGVVLIGHSQGSKLLLRLLQEEIDGKPIQKQIVSAIIPGSTVQVPSGKTVGGTFKSLPVCTGKDQVGCVIVYASYRDSVPPSATPPARFGRSQNGMRAVCTNPAALGSTDKVTLDAYMTKGDTVWTTVDEIDTAFVRVPGLINGQCVTRGDFTYLEISVNADPADARTDTIAGDRIVDGKPDPTWGLHRIDIAVTLGNLLAVIERQTQIWLQKK